MSELSTGAAEKGGESWTVTPDPEMGASGHKNEGALLGGKSSIDDEPVHSNTPSQPHLQQGEASAKENVGNVETQLVAKDRDKENEPPSAPQVTGSDEAKGLDAEKTNLNSLPDPVAKNKIESFLCDKILSAKDLPASDSVEVSQRSATSGSATSGNRVNEFDVVISRNRTLVNVAE